MKTYYTIQDNVLSLSTISNHYCGVRSRSTFNYLLLYMYSAFLLISYIYYFRLHLFIAYYFPKSGVTDFHFCKQATFLGISII